MLCCVVLSVLGCDAFRWADGGHFGSWLSGRSVPSSYVTY